MKLFLAFILILQMSVVFAKTAKKSYRQKASVAKKTAKKDHKKKKKTTRRRLSKKTRKMKGRKIAKKSKRIKKSKVATPSKKKAVSTANLVYKKPNFRKHTEKLNFNYFTQFLGPSLDSRYQSGATYNRFKTGQDFKGDPLDATGSHQMFHAITLGYNIAPDYNLSFGYTFQEDINKDIRYKDSWGQTAIRNKQVSDNNKRINLLVRNVVNNKNFFINTNYFYELSSTINSVYQDMEYGLGFEPTVGFYHGNTGFSSGFFFSVQRNFFKENEILFEGNLFPTRYQTMLVQFNPYLNYRLSDYITLQSSLMFDWDKRGDQINDFGQFNANMDDVGRFGVSFNVDYGITAGTFFEFGLEDAGIAKTAIGATLNVTLF